MRQSVNKSVPAIHLGEFSGRTGAFSSVGKIWNNVLKRAAGVGELVGEDVAAVAVTTIHAYARRPFLKPVRTLLLPLYQSRSIDCFPGG